MILATLHTGQLNYVHEVFREALQAVNDDCDGLDVRKLEMIAKIRFVLGHASRLIGETEIDPVVNGDDGDGTVGEKKTFIQELNNICEIDSFRWPR